MMETHTNTAVKAKAKPALGAFETPKFDLPKFDIPKMEVPAAFREIAEKGVSQAKENYEKLKIAAEEATDVLEETYATATKGGTEYGLKLIEAGSTQAKELASLVQKVASETAEPIKGGVTKAFSKVA